MPTLEYFVVAESFSTDRDTGAISIFKVLNDLQVDELPYVLPKWVAVGCWICSREEIDAHEEVHLKLRVQIPNEEEKSTRGSFSASTRFQTVIFELPGIALNAGDTEVILEVNEEHAARHIIDLKQRADD